MNLPVSYLALCVFGLCCYVYLLHLLLKGHVRAYLLLFIDLIVLFLTTISEVGLYGMEIYAKVFYINDLIRQVIVFALVISLVYRALTTRTDKRWLGRWLIAGATLLVVIFLSYAMLHREHGFIRPMTNAVRNMSVTAMVMNLILWMLLLGSRSLDRLLLTVTSGLGVQMAGEAIGQSLRLMTRTLTPFGNFVLIASHFLCLFIWIGAFRRPARHNTQPR